MSVQIKKSRKNSQKKRCNTIFEARVAKNKKLREKIGCLFPYFECRGDGAGWNIIFTFLLILHLNVDRVHFTEVEFLLNFTFVKGQFFIVTPCILYILPFFLKKAHNSIRERSKRESHRDTRHIWRHVFLILDALHTKFYYVLGKVFTYDVRVVGTLS